MRLGVLFAILLLAGAAAAQEVQPVPSAPRVPEEPCAGGFASVRAGMWRHSSFEALTSTGLRSIEAESLGLGGIDLGWRVHQLSTWLSFDYASADDVSIAAVGANVGWRQRLPTGEALPLWAGLSAGVIGGRLEVDETAFGDFDPGLGFQARGELEGRLGYGVGISFWADYRHLAFDFDESVLSGDDEAVGPSVALGGALTFRF